MDFTEEFRNRVKTTALVVVTVLILLLGNAAAGWVNSQRVLTEQLTQWALQQRELQLRAAQQQGLVSEQELRNDNSGSTEGVDSGAAPRK